MRRTLVALLITLTLLATHGAVALAQESTPGAGGPGLLGGFGLPELHVTISQDGLSVAEQATAGQMLLTVENQLEFPAGFSIVQLPEGTSLEEAMAIFGPPPDAGAASPAAGEEPTGPEGPPPPLFFEMTWAGGAFVPPMGQAQVIVTLTEGQWILLSDPESGLMPMTLDVAAGAATPDAAGAVTADVTVEMKNYQIVLPEQIQPGAQVWEVGNTGDEPHELFVVRTPRLLTVDEVQQLLDLPEGTEPPPGIPDPAEFEDLGGVAPISNGQTVWVEMNLEPGFYVAVCFMPDDDSGMPHAMKGMYVIFEVAEAGQQAAPPASPVPQDEEHPADAMATPTA